MMVGSASPRPGSSNMESSDLSNIFTKLSEFPSARIKLEDLFAEWISLDATKRTINDVLEDVALRSASGAEDAAAAALNAMANSGAGADSNLLERIVVSTSMGNLSVCSSGGSGMLSQLQPPRSPTKASPKKRTVEDMRNEDKMANSVNDGQSCAAEGGSKDLGSKLVTSGVDRMGLGDGSLSKDVHGASSSSAAAQALTEDGEASSTRRHRANVDCIPIFYTPPSSGSDGEDGEGSTDRGPARRGSAIHKRLEEDTLSKRLNEIEVFFKPYPQGIPIEKFVHVTKRLCNIPSFFNLPLCKRINTLYGDEGPNVHLKSVGNKTNRQAAIGSGTRIKMKAFMRFWQTEIEPFDRAERFFRLVKQVDSDCICKDDFIPYIQELLHFHPGLDFLQQHEEFQRKYALTVITRIFYKVNRSRTGRISLRELRHSNLMTEFMHVDEETDINKVTEYFSYEHFYVLYCRFFELDADKDTKLGPDDLLKYSEHALSEAIVDRIFQLGTRAFTDGIEGGFNRAGLSGTAGSELAVAEGAAAGSEGSMAGGMTYPDFVYFMLSEEDKTNECALRYWFNCCDLDSSGVISIDEMRFFYRMQLTRLTNLGQETVSFQDVLCQMLDMLAPDDPQNLKIKDFLRPNKIQLSGILFDVLFNLHKFLRFEGRDPFQEKQKREDPFNNDWDRFAYTEYHRLAAEEDGYDNGGDDSGITMDIEDNVALNEAANSGNAYNTRNSYYDDDDDNSGDYGAGKPGDGGGAGSTDWYLDDDDDDDDGDSKSRGKGDKGKAKGKGKK